MLELVPQIQETFGFADEVGDPDLDDVFGAIFELCSVVDAERPAMLGHILADLAAQSELDPARFRTGCDSLHELFAEGLRYGAAPRSMYGGSKVIGRCIFSLVESMPSAQRSVLARWEAAALSEATHGSSRECFGEEDRALMSNCLAWFDRGRTHEQEE